MLVFLELKHLLLQVLPSPAMIAHGRSMCIQNHLAMVSDSLWAINSMIVIPEMGVLYNEYLQSKEEFDRVLDVPTEFADWEIDVAAAVIDVGGLLGRILDWDNIQQVHFRHVILVEMKEILCNLNSLVLRGSAMGLRRDLMGSMNPLREDYSSILKNEVVGREEDLEKLIASFQRRLDDSDPFVIVIVGEQGIGKTTLAHMIYHHTWIRQQFHHRIWMDLPHFLTFKMINIIGKEFARSLINEEEHCDPKLHLELPLQAMWEYINEQLDGSRYLLVLHCQDLASLMRQEWNELKNILLRVGGPGSVVLIVHKSSTHLQLASDISFLNEATDIRTYCLNPLSEDARMELFKRHAATAFPLKNDELIPFAKQHFQNLIGQPFGAKFFGSLSHNIQATLPGPLPAIPESIYMLGNLSVFDVRLLQYAHLLDAETDNDYDVILDMLTAEYHLPTEGLAPGWTETYDSFLEQIYITWELSKCLFPRMIYLHMKVPEDSTTAVPKRCRYLCLEINHRAMPFRLPTIPVEVSDKLIALILQEEETTLEVYENIHTEATTTISKFLSKILVRLIHLRILVVKSSIIQRLPSEVNKLVNLKYLHLSNLKMELLPKSLFELFNLRILSLLRCQKLQRISEGIRKLKKLQILKLTYCTKLQQLPKSITGLKYLEELNVEGYCWLSKLPEDLISFKSLRVLDIVGCASLSQIPGGIEQLIGLRKLLEIFASVDGGFGLSQLQTLTNLREIGLRNLERAKETQTEVLMGQQNLWDLSLHWSVEDANESSESATSMQVLLEAFRPNLHLQRLEIISYEGVEFPTWMSKQQLAHFVSLVEVRLFDLRSCVRLPSLGQLPNFIKLEVSRMDLITNIDDTFYGDGDVFPMLAELTFSEMLALEKWSVPKRKNAKFFPELEELILIQCPKLKEIDLLCYSNFTMRVWLNNKTIWSVEFCNWDNLRYIRDIEIVGCQELRWLPHGMQRLKHLTEMTINSCNNLTNLIALDSLRSLYLYACPMLEFNLEAFPKLSQLKIKSCPKIQIDHEN